MGNGENGRIIGLVLNSWEYIMKKMTIMAPPLPLLPVANHPINSETLQTLDLVKVVLSVAVTGTLGLLFSGNYDSAAGPHQLIVSAMMAAFMILWIGTLLGTIFPCFGSIVQLLGISLVLLLFFGLVATCLSGGFSLACWLSGALCVMAFVYVAVKPQAADHPPA